MNSILVAVLFFLPAGVANMAPVLAKNIPGLDRWKTPIDFGKHYRGKRLLGENKTLRGLLFGGLLGGISAVIIAHFVPEVMVTIPAFCVGLLLGLGALVGDAVESFFKRQADVKPGNSWFPFDQIDYIIGALLFVYPFVRLELEDMLTILVIYFCLHIIVSYLAFRTGFKDKAI